MNKLVYQKRSGTSGVSGQLYETKLLSLMLFRLLHDEDVVEFYIGTNMDGLGEFDDICFRFKAKGFDKPVAVFLQAKHRDDQNRPLTVTKTDLTKYFKSYLNVRNRFNVNSSDAFFKGAYEDVECVFVFYTNTKDEMDKEYHKINYFAKINDLINTGNDAFKLPYTENDVKPLNEIVLRDNIDKLAILIADIVKVGGKKYKTLMDNELIQTYHVILSQRVFTVTDVQRDDNTDYRVARLSSNFFDTTDEHLQLLRNGLVYEALKDYSLSLPSYEPSVRTISKEYIEEIVNKKKFTSELSIAITREEYCLDFKLPAAFGNRDLTLRGESSRKEKRLCYLANKLVKLIKESNNIYVNGNIFNVVYIDDNFPDKGFLRLNGGIAGAVGNLLIFDDDTRLLKFKDSNDLAGHAKTLFDKINSEIKELGKYRFDVRVKNFPKLSFDCNEHDKSMVLDFTNRLLFCTNQARESEVEHILKADIGRLQNTRERCNFQIKSDAIFLAYHDEIQKWWLQEKNAKYLTKTSHVFENSIERFIRNPLLSVANALHRNKIMINDLKFNAEVINSLELDESFSMITVIVSEVIDLSVVKVTQYIKNDDYYLIDLNYILNLPVNDCSRLHEELTNVEDKIFILTYRSSNISKLNIDNKDILQTLKRKKLIVVTNNGSLSEIRKFLAHPDLFIVDDTCSLLDLTEEPQETITKNTDVIFQGVHVNLNLLVDDDARVFIKGELMDKIMSGEVIRVGEPLTTPRYEEIKDFYISRIVTLKHVFHKHQDVEFIDEDIDPEEGTEEEETIENDDDGNDIKEEEAEVVDASDASDEYYDSDGYDDDDTNYTDSMHQVEIKVESFYDIDEHAVLITAEPGLGKSSLLTHLSLTTKARDPGVWIVRINLLDYSRFFHQWMENKVVIDILEALRFICVALVSQNVNEKLILIEKNGGIYVKDCCIETDKVILFQINMFLHYCSRRKVIFAFDGFDEICPHYEPQVLQFLNVLKHYRSHKHRIWITSRTYSKILRSLESIFEVYHQLEPFNFIEQQLFIQRYLKLKLDLNELNQKQIEKIDDFIAFMAQSGRTGLDWTADFGIAVLHKYRSLPLHTVYLDAVQYFKDEIKHVLFLQDKDKYVKAWDLDVDEMRNDRRYNGKSYGLKNNMLEFIAAPLHIYMVADYFQHQIKHAETDTIWDLNLNTYAMYEHFVETKLRKIRFEEKNQMDLYKPDNQFTFEREKKKCINEHKKLAAYAVFYEDVNQLFIETELEEIRRIVITIDSGREKTGVICTVINGVPRFVHLTFAEYFAVEYICDKLKAEQSDDDLKSIWDFIFNTVFHNNNLGVLNVLDDKLIMDEELRNKTSDARSRRIIFDLLMKQNKSEAEKIEKSAEKTGKYVYVSSLFKAMSENLRNLTSLFLSTFEFMTADNVKDLVKIITGTGAIPESLILSNNMEFIDVVLDTVREVDPSAIGVLFDKFGYARMRCGDITNEMLVDIVKQHFISVGIIAPKH